MAGTTKDTIFQQAGDAPTGQIAGDIPTSLENSTTYGAAGAFSQQSLAVVSGEGSESIITAGSDSLFNPLYTFRYAKFSAGFQTYQVDLHRDKEFPSNQISQTVLQRTNQTAQTSPGSKIREFSKRAESPTANAIIDWARSTGKIDGKSILGPTPYQLSDFLWCKWYGKIPNNRLLTIRRYPIPVEDNLQIADSKGPLVPLAQAVSWWGGDTGNSLSEILGMSYGLNWDDLLVDANQVIEGNELTADDALNAIGLENKTARQFLLAALASDPSRPFAANGYDALLQDWAKKSYGETGAYWNRMLGPVNVINSTQIRKVGYSYSQEIKLKFTYKLRSFNSVNPKIAMLDLISNFLALTYNRASFWGGSSRYFTKPGYLLAGIPTGNFENADYVKGIVEFLKASITGLQGKAEGFAKFLSEVIGNVSTGNLGEAADQIVQSTTFRDILASQVRNLMRAPLTIRSVLDGRAVGEWHLTVGNPMNPIAVIGNLCLKSTTMKFSDSLGLDDFPSEVEFTLTLIPGRPRAKQDIESMFNLGGGDMYFTTLAPPSTARNSHGEYTTAKLQAAYEKDANLDQFDGRSAEARLSENPTGGASSDQIQADISNLYGPRVSRAYGDEYGKSPILSDYFRDLKTYD